MLRTLPKISRAKMKEQFELFPLIPAIGLSLSFRLRFPYPRYNNSRQRIWQRCIDLKGARGEAGPGFSYLSPSLREWK